MEKEIWPFGFGGFRSFPPGVHRLSVVGCVNLIAGPNNGGKSNVLRFICEHYGTFLGATHKDRNARWVFTEIDRYQGAGDGSVWFAIGLRLGSREYELLLNHSTLRQRTKGRGAALLEQLLQYLAQADGTCWFDFQAPTPGNPFEPKYPDEIRKALPPDGWRALWEGLTGSTGGSPAAWVPETLRAITPNPPKPECYLVSAVREIGAPGTEKDFSGHGIIGRLAELQNPSFAQQEDKERFEGINRFVQVVLDDASAQIEVPHKRDMILVHQQGRTLPLDSLGTGVHEVVILAAAATVLTNSVICIEEPELHLHPVLQRKLVAYLAEKTSNQYFITTHSAALLDTRWAVIYHVSHDGASSAIRLAQGTGEHFELCRALGYRASDLLQANCVIWVEGPSDRIYLEHWISQEAPEFVEGLQYSIMFYGGRLLSHLSADDEEVTEFISLRRLNRHVAIVMDSDLKAPNKEINATKARVQGEIGEHGGLAWITAGREMENYVPPETMKGALTDLKGSISVPPSNRFQVAYRYKDAAGEVRTDVDKVKLAQRVTMGAPPLDILDLRERIEELVAFIRNANP